MTDTISIDDQFTDGNQDRLPHTNIQWKGTDLCMDFYCECGAACHFDGYSPYCVICPHCNAVWEMPVHVFPRRADHRTYAAHVKHAKMMAPDEDHCDENGKAFPLSPG